MYAPINFAFHDKAMRVVMIDGDPWWVAADLCAILDLRNVTQAVGRLDPIWVTLCLAEGIGKGAPVNVVSEPGMWMLVMRSDKAEAEELRRLLASEVLPSLRKYGTYSLPGFEPPPVQAMDLDPARLVAGVSVVREARRLFGPVAARGLWVQVGLPPVVADAEAEAAGDPLAVPLLAYLADRAETTIAQAAEGMGIDVPDWTTRQRIGRLLNLWGWRNRTCKRDRRAVRVYSRPASSVTIDQGAPL